jgi:hypothetical protein
MTQRQEPKLLLVLSVVSLALFVAARLLGH